MNIIIAGDFCPQQRVLDYLNKGDFESVFSDIKPIVGKADYAILNLECPITHGNEQPIEKCGPNLCCSGKVVNAIKWMGFDCVTLANNHFLDYGEEGVKNTLAACNNNGIDTVGGGLNLHEASRILYKKMDGKSFAVINCCEHEFSVATEMSAGSNPLNPIQQYYAIKEAREKADFVLVIVHGGNEHYQLPSPRMKETYRFFVDAGADAVVNHHQHCYSGYELYKGKPIFYGIGNFCFDNQYMHNSIWNKGYIVILNTESRDNIQILPYIQCDEEPNISISKDMDKSKILEDVEKLNVVIQDDKELSHLYSLYLAKNVKSMLLGFEPYKTSRLTTALYTRNLLPSFLSKEKINWLINFIGCESHSPKLMTALNIQKINKK